MAPPMQCLWGPMQSSGIQGNAKTISMSIARRKRYTDALAVFTDHAPHKQLGQVVTSSFRG